jgi:hypothetical protein
VIAMHTSQLRLWAFALLVLLGEGVHAQGELRKDVGELSCTDFLKIAAGQNQEAKLIVVSWLQGYYAGMNNAQSAFAPDRGLKAIPEGDSLLAHMVLYCKKMPSGQVMRGAIEIFPLLPDLKK